MGRYPAYYLMERMPIYQRCIFNKYPHAGPLFYAVLVRLSTGYPPLIGKLHTRYSPVRRSPTRCCHLSLPLDLHVLSLSLAFILSQDQTLHSNKNFKNYLFRSVIISVESLLGLALAVCFQTFQYL